MLTRHHIVKFVRLGSGNNCTPAVRAALDECRRNGTKGLLFPAGTYHFYPEGTEEKYCYISNNDSGFKKIVFLLKGLSEFSIIGENSRFIFHGRIIPFVVEDCRQINLCGFSVDFDRSFISRAEVLTIGKDWMDLQLTADDLYRIEDDRIVFFDDLYRHLRPYLNFMEFDIERQEPLADTNDCYVTNRASELEPGKIRIHGIATPPRMGATIVIKHELRLQPCIVIDHCSDIFLEEVVLHHSCGMGVIAQHCQNLVFSKVRVTLNPENERLISISDDATHFVNCRGHIHIENCLFENQWDDAINVHGIYRKIRRRSVGANPFLYLEAGHYQQMGIEIAAPGETMEFVDRRTLLTYCEAKVKSVMPLTPQITKVEFEGALPERLQDGDGVANLDWTPSLTVCNCTIRNNKPRGILCTTPRKVLIENNYFHTPGAAIYISGDANFWFESGAVKDVTIRNNIFENCNYMKNATGKAVIDISPEIEQADPTHSYHQGIRIENNVFCGIDSNVTEVLNVSSTADLQVVGNKY